MNDFVIDKVVGWTITFPSDKEIKCFSRNTTNTTNYRYDILSASLDESITEHPYLQMKLVLEDLNIDAHIIKSEPVSIGDCWWFRTNKHLPKDKLPIYITELPSDFKFSGE